MQIKTTVRCHFTLEIDVIKKMVSVGNVEKLEVSDIAGGNEKQCGSSSKG